MNSQPRDHLTSVLEDRLHAGASSDQIADLIAVACQGIDAALAPILGRRGVDALFRRSLHLTGRRHRWLAATIEGDQAIFNVGALKSSLALQTSSEAASGGLLLLKTFNDLLVNLIGPSLTERLLRSVWATLLSGPSGHGFAP